MWWKRLKHKPMRTQASEELAFNTVQFSQYTPKTNLNTGDGGRICGTGRDLFTLLPTIHIRSYLMDTMYCFSRSKEGGS